jgi:cytochrome c-type biogenesis protein CcmH
VSFRRTAAIATIATTLVVSATALAAPAPRASLTDVENDVMCVACREPLAVSQSPQAISERNFIRHLIALGETKPQIEQALVGQYGPAVLGRPPASGFNLTVYILPPAIVLSGIVVLALTLPRWRRRTRAAALGAATATPTPGLDPASARRLDEDLARYD